MVVTCNSFGVSGMDGYKVELEASMYNGTREFDMVGLPDAAVRGLFAAARFTAIETARDIEDRERVTLGRRP